MIKVFFYKIMRYKEREETYANNCSSFWAATFALLD